MKCKHSFADQRIIDEPPSNGRYVICLKCYKVLADSWAPLNEVYDVRDYEKVEVRPTPPLQSDTQTEGEVF